MLGIAALTLTAATWLHYLWLIPKERVPERPVAHSALHVVAILMAAGAALDGEHLAAPFAAVVLGGFFLWLLTQARMPDAGTLSVGATAPAFTALRADGSTFDSSELDGHRVLLKLFRGHW